MVAETQSDDHGCKWYGATLGWDGIEHCPITKVVQQPSKVGKVALLKKWRYRFVFQVLMDSLMGFKYLYGPQPPAVSDVPLAVCWRDALAECILQQGFGQQTLLYEG